MRTVKSSDSPFVGHLCLGILSMKDKPVNLRPYLDFMVFINEDWIQAEYRRTSEIVLGFFPLASKEIIDLWLLREMDDALYAVGYSPVENGESDGDGVEDDPIWFCDGDRRTIQYSLLGENNESNQ